MADEKYDNELLPPPDDEELGLKVFWLLSEILRDKQDQSLPQRWLYYYKLKRNKHWKNPDKPGLVSANLLHPHRKRIVNMLTDNNPTFNVKKMGQIEEGQEQVYDDIINLCEHWWLEEEQQAVLQRSVDNGETYGVTIEKSVFNDQAEGGIGEVETIIVDPFHFGVYPTNVIDNQKAEANLHFYPMSIREARRTWPDKAKEIKADRDLMKELGDERKTIHGGRGGGGRSYLTEVLGTVYKMFSKEAPQYGEEDQCLIVEAHVKDYSLRKTRIRTPVLDDQGRPTDAYEEIDGPLEDAYKGNIRCVRVCNGGELVLDDRDNPSINPNLDPELAKMTYLWYKFPFTLTQSESDNSTIWAPPDAEQLEGLVIEVNKTLTVLNMYKDKATRLKLKNPKTSGVSNSELTNAPGIVRPKNAIESAGLGWIDPPKVPIDLKVIYDILKDLFFLVGGDFEAELAKSLGGGGNVAYKTIAALMERVSTMLRGKDRNYGKMIRERGRMFLSHVQNWYTQERFIPYKDPETGEENAKSIVGKTLIVPSKLTFVQGSTMPVSRVQEREEAQALHKQGVIDDEELLKKFAWQDYRNVLKRKQMGPLANLLSMMAKIGAPQQLIAAMAQLQQADPQKFNQALKKGEIPSFQELLGEGQEPPEAGLEGVVQEAEIMERRAKAENTRANTELTQEKIITERIIQYVKASGVKLDEEQLKLKRAQFVAEMESNKIKLKTGQTTEFGAKKSPDQGPFREKGMVSNNAE